MTDTAQTWQRSLPSLNPESQAFWDGCKNRQLLVQRCRQCGQRQTYYRAFCCFCWSNEIDDEVDSGEGTVWAFTVTYQNATPGWKEDVPYCMAAVELAEGVKLVTNIVNCDPESVYVGMPVKVTFVDATDEVTIPYFEPR